MDANDSFTSLMLMIRGHKDFTEIDVLELVGVPNTPEGELAARCLLRKLEKNIMAIESVGDALVENMNTLSEENLVVYSNQLKFCADAIELYQGAKQAMQELIRNYWDLKSQQN